MNTIKLNTIGDSPVVVKKGSQVQSQEKTIEITENGTTEVVPDAGYALSKVTVNTNVQGGSGGESGGDWHYFDVSGCDTVTKAQVLQTSSVHKVQGENINTIMGASVIMPTGMGYMIPIDKAEITAVAIDYALEVKIGEQVATLRESITTAPWYGQVPEITKEQFYNLS